MCHSSPLCPAFILSVELHCCKAKGYSFIYTIQQYANEQALIINISQMNLYKLAPLTLPGARHCSPGRIYLSSWAGDTCTNVCSTWIPRFFLDPFSPTPTWFELSAAELTLALSAPFLSKEWMSALQLCYQKLIAWLWIFTLLLGNTFLALSLSRKMGLLYCSVVDFK